MTANKLIEDFRTTIKGIFKESADAALNPIAMPPAPMGDSPAPIAPTDTIEPQVEEEKVTMSVSLLKSLLDWAHGEEEAEEEEGEVGGEESQEQSLEQSPEVATQIAEEEEAAEVEVASSEGEAEGETEELEDAGVEAIEIQALVDKVKELSQTKGELTDEDFGEIVAAAEASEEGAPGEAGEAGEESLAGILDDAPNEITENIGEIIPKGAKFKNEGNKGIGK
jgi:hypothetical protein